ncbi:MAG: RidA family protein [Fibrobacterales bacterium]
MKQIKTSKAPMALGPYSQAVLSRGTLYSSGQIALNPHTKKIEGSTIEEQTRQVLTNIEAILLEAGMTLSNVVKTTVFMQNLEDFAQMNAVYEEAFGESKPARATVEVSRLPADALIEIECIALEE